jgi:hypothetical protein
MLEWITAASCMKYGRKVAASMVHSSLKMLKAATFSFGAPSVTQFCKNGRSSGQPPGSEKIETAAYEDFE